MKRHTEQFVGALFRVLADEGHDEVQKRLLESYHSKASIDRDELAANMFSELVTVLHQHLDTRDEIDVLTTATRHLLNRFSTVIGVVPVAIVVVDAAGQVQLWNEGAERTFGWSESEILTQSYLETLSPPPDLAETVRGRLEAGERLDGVETRHQHQDGSILDVRLWAAPLSHRESGFGGAAFVVSDITEQKQREQRLAVLNRVLRHNIRNDVNVVQGHLDMLIDSLPENDEHANVIQRRLTNIIELSDAARYVEQLQSDGMRSFATLDLGALLRTRLDRLDSEYPNAEIHATMPESLRVAAHELLPYALDNILENALKHNDSGVPHVTVDVQTEDDDRRTIRIEDDGPGLPETEREVLTTRTETPLTHSAGMGLWLASWILRHSGGDLTVEDGQSGGTRVTIQLNAPPQ
ncbi:PAS domain S-box protein [Halogeometricum borinquense]|uniref:histidine kinase n=1 Tax=Halogeometricum borinquense TaxID=60847 RepID=A0A482TMR4_9EURY|nr:PAS domain S-box protein [Halogeometricum borinquense]RYJ14501.1 PAS domain S-box protein [Halogeometricum borinquense]